MPTLILRLQDATSEGFYEEDLVIGRRPLEQSPVQDLAVPAFEGPAGSKCLHGVYVPYGEKLARYCSICNPYVLEVPERLLKAIRPSFPDPEEARLLELVASEALTEEQALKRLDRPSGSYAPQTLYDINKAYEQYAAGQLPEKYFWESLLRFVRQTVKRHSPDGSTYSNIEDAITESALRVWQKLGDFDAQRSSFRTFASIIVLAKIRDLLRQYKTDRGGFEHVQLNENEVEAPGLSVEERLLFKEWLATLESTDRQIMQLLKDGLTQQEIGEALGMSQSAVAQRLDRIKSEEKPPFSL